MDGSLAVMVRLGDAAAATVLWQPHPGCPCPSRYDPGRGREGFCHYLLAFYAGWPKAMSAITVARNLFRGDN
ncbi:hypothetical protein GCM10022255_084120 [Dactylosporangium darangshiense]|uniref:SWIM-type domain-containing protein n=1 Tax=Dactylosporangium darangshiense TaxID=579108 RepID=A0ABP8DMK3_9ACTN